MKTKFLSLIAIGSLLLASCSEDGPEKFTYSGQDFISLEDINSEAFTIGENEDSGSITFRITRPMSTDLTVNFTIEEIDVNVGYSIPSTSIVIPAGQTEGQFVVIPVNDEDNTPSTRIRATITSTSPEIKIGLREPGSFTKVITIVNDDCPTRFNLWFGSLSVEDVGYGSTPGTGSANANGDCDILRVVNNLPGIGAPTNSTYDLVFTPFFPGAASGTVEVSPTVSRSGLTANGQPANAVYSATGTYDEEAGLINLDYVLQAINSENGSTIGTYWTGQNVIPVP